MAAEQHYRPVPFETLSGAWQDLRNRLLARTSFQRWARRFPLTRPVARRRTRELFDLCAGFVYAQVLHACVRLDLLRRLEAGPRSAESLAPELGLAPAAAERLLRAAAALRLVARRRGGYGLGDLGAALLANPGALAMIAHHEMLYDDLRDPVALLRGEADTALSRFWAYAAAERPAKLGDREIADYSLLMARSQALVAAEVLDAYRVESHRRLLDVGGGTGEFLVAAAGRAPRLELRLFDLPAVAARARARLAEAGLAGRSRVHGGDVFRDPLPEGADLITLVRVVHDHDDAAAATLLAAARRALAPGGTLLLAEPMAGQRGAEPIGDAYFGFYLLAMGRGRPRSAAELGALLRAAGFGEARPIATRMPLLTGLMAARA